MGLINLITETVQQVLHTFENTIVMLGPGVNSNILSCIKLYDLQILCSQIAFIKTHVIIIVGNL
jgi:hypothetical protein